ncbi:MAG: HAMP domain-containing histidine kinase [bacterium]|nr:HAMP domain-containing histidine kinase [bacterium]
MSSSRKSLAHKLFITAIFFNVLWTLGTALFIGIKTESIFLIGANLFFVAPMFTAYFLLLYSIAYEGDIKKPTTLAIVAALPLLIMSYGIIADSSLIMSGYAFDTGLNYFSLNKSIFILYTAFFSLYFGGSYIGLFLRYRRQKGIEKVQTKAILYAAITSSFLAMFTNLSLPYFGDINHLWLGPVFTLFYIGIVTFSVIRHKLFDIKIAAARASAYIFSLGIIIMIYGGSIYILGEKVFGDNEASRTVERFIFILFAIVTAAIFQPLKKFFDRITNFVFYRDAYNTSDFIGELNALLAQTTNLDSLLLPSARIIQKHMRLEFVVFGIKETSTVPRRIVGTTKKTFKESDISDLRKFTAKIQLQVINGEHLKSSERSSANYEVSKILSRYNVSILARLTDQPLNGAEGVGYLALGGKKSGNMFTPQDIEVLGIVVNSLVLGIQNALRFEEIEQFNETLQEKIYVATKELKQSNEKLKALDEAKDEFISMASHQLRTPLTSVKGYLSMLAEGDAGKLNETQKKFVDQSFVSAQRMVYLISDLLNVSRLKTGKFVIERVQTHLPDVVEQEIAQLYETAASKGIKFEYKKPEEFPSLMLDETKVRQVIMNFCDNALYYTPSGGSVTLSLDESAKQVSFTVTDTGMGVPKSEQHHLFTKFYRAGNARKVRPDGTGLGLFMAKKAIIAQGGTMIFKSAEGKGSTFGFSFPKDNHFIAVNNPK